MNQALRSSKTDFDLFSVGQMTLDTIVDHRGTHGLFPGGGALYPAVVAAQLGFRSAIYSKVGKDFPEETLARMRAAGVNGEAIRQVEGLTAKVTISYPSGSQQKADIAAGVGYDLSVSEIPESHWNSKVIHVSAAQRPFLHHFLERARAQKHTLLSFAPKSDLRGESRESLVELFSQVDALFLNDLELSLYAPGSTLTGRLLNLAREGPEVIVVTLGEQGSLIHEGQQVHEIKAFSPGEIRNVSGAGDAYLVGFWYAYLRGCSLPDCGAFASRVAVCVMPSYGLPLNTENFAPILSDRFCQKIMAGPLCRAAAPR